MRISHFILILCSVIALSCNKEKIDLTSHSASVTLVNAIASNDAEIIMNFTGQQIIYATSKTLNYRYSDGKYSNGALTYGIPIGRQLPLQVFLASDTSNLIFNQSLSFNKGDTYSLFISGYVENPTGILMKDELPVHTDSSTGVRFVNLCPNAGLLNVTIAGSGTGNIVENLPYQTATDYILLPASSSQQEYVLDIHDATTGDVLTSFVYNDLARMKNVTLVVKGLLNVDPGLEVARINQY